MSVPKFEEFLYPFLVQIKDRDLSSKEMRDALIAHFGLTEADCVLKTKSGTNTQVNDRINWVRQYLRRALFVDLPQKGVYHITERGKEYLQKHKTLSKKDLMAYPEFSKYATGATSTGATTPTSTSTIDEPQELTPTDLLEQAFENINRDLAEDLLQKVMDQTPRFFETLVVDLLKKMGYGGSFDGSTKVTPYVHDDGIDGIIYEDKLGLDKIYIQAKKYKADNTVGKPQIQQFAGALDEQKATKGVFITTSDYSDGARIYVEKLSKKIVLINGQELTRFMIEFNVGVNTKKTYDVKKLDSDYFEE
ncbi:restriction endonuclease [Candidatus Saccharibacteria bacterium]|nr:restriction endonuclease [Candidatus Saccharibacteria bacterium]